MIVIQVKNTEKVCKDIFGFLAKKERRKYKNKPIVSHTNRMVDNLLPLNKIHVINMETRHVLK